MKKGNKVYIYLNQEYWGEAATQNQAAKKCSVSTATVQQVLSKRIPCTKRGFYFSRKELTDEERYELPVKDNHFQKKDPTHWGRGCVREVEDQVYEVECTSPNVTYFPKKRSDKIDEFKTFLFTRFRERWLLIPKPLATLERQYIRDFLREMEK